MQKKKLLAKSTQERYGMWQEREKARERLIITRGKKEESERDKGKRNNVLKSFVREEASNRMVRKGMERGI